MHCASTPAVPSWKLELIWGTKEREQLLSTNLLWHWWCVRQGERRRKPEEIAFVDQTRTDEFMKNRISAPKIVIK
jgi:hypothetical protein